jgi:hypothetical protein
MGIDVAFIDEASGSEFARTVLEPEQLPETFAITTTMQLGGEDWDVVAAEPTARGAIERAGRLRLTVRKRAPITMVDPRTLQFSMPTICDPLPAPDPAVSLADRLVFVINEDLWRDVEWVARRHAPDIEENFAAIRAIRAAAQGPFPRVHPRATPVTSLLGSGLTVADVDSALGSDAERLDGVVIDTLGAGFIAGGFAFRLPDDAHVYGHCEGGEIATLGLHRTGPRESLPVALVQLADVLRAAPDAALVVWPYCEQIDDREVLETWYRSGRACTKMPW